VRDSDAWKPLISGRRGRLHRRTKRFTRTAAFRPDSAAQPGGSFVLEVAERLERSAGVKAVGLSLTVPMLNLLRTPILAEGQEFVPLG